MKAGTWNVFCKRFAPISASDGGDMHEWEAVKDLDERLVWTVLDPMTGTLYAATGFHIVNRLGYLICAKPWKEEERDREYVY